MSKEAVSIQVADVSAFARSLGMALRERHALRPAPPGQVELLNLIARAQGQRNWQALRASLRPPGGARPPAPDAPPPPVQALGERVRKALGQFDDRGRLIRWPAKFSVQKLVLWVLWTRFDAKRPYAEGEVNAVLKAANLFSDHATLRRELVNHRLLARKSDCSEYRKLPARPDDEARALIAACRSRFRDA
ncbi:MAG: DUF2087 domain-containing protein [Burkholderiales bacterium]|nr:DUF2087 domain-containing protein [Burkholderiales bacterium]